MGNLSHTSGNVGIGVSNPSNLLHLYGSNPVLNIQNTAASAGSGGEVVFGHNQSGSTTPIASVKGSLVDGGGVGSRAGDLKFYTSSNGSLTEKMVLTRDGRLGIGVASPTVALDVNGSMKVSGGFAANSLNITSSVSINEISQFTANAGIHFPDKPVWSERRKLLHAYEEGTWTPVYLYHPYPPATPVVSTLNVGYDTTLTKGLYTRIGNVVHWTAEVYTTSAPTGYGSGNVYLLLDGFPSFTGLSGGTNYSISWNNDYPRKTGRVGYAGGFSGYAPVYAYASLSNIGLYYLGGGAHSSNTIYLQPSNMSAVTHLMISGTQLLDNTF